LSNAAAALSTSATLSAGTTLRLYASSTSTIPLDNMLQPSTATVSSTTYYVAQGIGECESERVALVVNVVDSPVQPIVSSPVTYCIGATAAPISANLTLSTGATLRLYDNNITTTPLASTTQPSTTTAGSTTYYVAQAIGTCESSRVALVVNVVAAPSTPKVNSPLNYCLGNSTAPLNIAVTLDEGAILRLYESNTSTAPLVSTMQPTTTVAGVTTYYVAQMIGTCESGRVPLVVNVSTSVSVPRVRAALAIDANNIAIWGDSFVDANFGLMPKQLAQLTGRNVYNGGIGGQTSVQIKQRMLAATDKVTWPTIIWAGRNDSNNPEQVKASIANMVSSLGHTSYLVLSVFNGDGEGTGTKPYQQIVDLNNYLATTYGDHYLDLRSYIVSQYDRTQPTDVANYNADVPPNSLRQDFLHPNSAGTTLMSNYIYAHINNLLIGDVQLHACQNSTSLTLGSLVDELLPGAKLKVYASPTSTTPLGTGNLFALSTENVGTMAYYICQQVDSCESGRLRLLVSTTNCGTSGVARVMTSEERNLSMFSNSVSSETGVQLHLQAYPNPFTDNLTVDFSLPASEHYTLKLYNAQGQIVSVVADGQGQPQQNYQFQIDSRELAIGMYMLRLTTSSGSTLQRCVLSR
jgi:hypothetical protein